MNGIFSALRERVRAVFVGTYIISWLVINYRPMLVLFFSDAPIERRYGLMDELWFGPWVVYGLPFLITLTVLLLGIIADAGIFYFRRYFSVRMKTRRLDDLIDYAVKRQMIAEHEASTERAAITQQQNFELKRLDLEYQIKYKDAQTNKKALETEISSLTDRLDDAKNQIDHFRRQSDETQSQYGHLIRQSADSDAKADALKRQLNEHQDYLKRMRSEKETWEDEKRRMVRELDDARNKVTGQAEIIRNLQNSRRSDGSIGADNIL